MEVVIFKKNRSYIQPILANALKTKSIESVAVIADNIVENPAPLESGRFLIPHTLPWPKCTNGSVGGNKNKGSNSTEKSAISLNVQ